LTYANIFQYFFKFNHRVGAFLITELALFCSVIWRIFVWELGVFLFGRLAKLRRITRFCSKIARFRAKWQKNVLFCKLKRLFFAKILYNSDFFCTFAANFINKPI